VGGDPRFAAPGLPRHEIDAEVSPESLK
jgi:hypothetical protein